MGFALAAIAAELRDPGDGIFHDITWLKESWEQPQAFAHALLQYHAGLDSAPIKSTPKDGYDLYHDLVLRNVQGDRVALFWLDEENRPQRLTYAQLHLRCSARRTQWLERGVHAGQRLCVLANLVPELLVALLTGLRMGLEVSLLPPAGAAFVLRRLQALDTDWVAMARRYQPLLRDTELAEKVLIEPVGAAPVVAGDDATSHTYSGEAVALQLFAPAHDPPEQAVAVTAADAYHGALRDGLLLLGLHPGQVVAVAEQNLLQVQPALLLATLIRGAALLPLQASSFALDVRHADPLASLPPVQVLFANAALRAIMLQAPPRPVFSRLNLWVSSPQEAPAPNEWNSWLQRWSLHATPAMSLVLDAACGGSILFSRRRLGSPPGYLMPAPGRPFELLQPDDSGDPARGDSGVFQPAPSAVGLLLTRIDGGYLYAGTREPTQDGQHYPKTEVEEAVQDLPFVHGASVVEEPVGRGGSTLLIFTGPETQSYALKYVKRRQDLLRMQIVQRLTPDYLPARIIVTSQLPRLLDGGQIDHQWCAQMLLTGELRRRAANPVFAMLDRLLVALMPALQRKKS